MVSNTSRLKNKNSRQNISNKTKTHKLTKLKNTKNKYQKNNVPPRTKVQGLTGTCFLDAQSGFTV